MRQKRIEIFISYSRYGRYIAENLHSRFKGYGIETWIYSRDKQLGNDIWQDIKHKIMECRLMLWLFSSDSQKSTGQAKEIQIFYDIEDASPDRRLVPVVLDETRYEELPKLIKNLNGLRLSIYDIETFVISIINQFFPELKIAGEMREWYYPRPADWLKVCTMNAMLESDGLRIGDKVYFCRISPLGLFECYTPKINGLYWFAPKSLKLLNIGEKEKENMESLVPDRYTIITMIRIESAGLRTLEEQGMIHKPSPRKSL